MKRSGATPPLLHSPTERGAIIAALQRLGKQRGVRVASSGRVEPKGVDFLWVDWEGQWRGVQRKELTDYVASHLDGRLAKEVGQMASHVDLPVLVLEGRPMLTNDGDGTHVTVGEGRWSKTVSYHSYVRQMLSLADLGMQVWTTANAAQTAEMILAYHQWSQAEHHSTAATRPKPAGDWGKPTNQQWQEHLLQGIDGIGPKTARDIIETLGRCPLRVDADVEELMTVPGVGRKTAEKIILGVNGEL